MVDATKGLNFGLFLDALRVLVADLVDEFRADGMTRPELVELATLAWRQIEPGAVYWLDSAGGWDNLRASSPSLDEWVGRAVMVPEHLCGGECPTRPGWLEWFGTVLACFVLLWGSEGHSRPFVLFGVVWDFPP